MIGKTPHYGSYVALRLADAGNAAGAQHPARSGIVGGQRLFDIAVEQVELFAQITRAAF